MSTGQRGSSSYPVRWSRLRCLATGEILAETDEELAWIAMEDLRAHGPSAMASEPIP